MLKKLNEVEKVEQLDKKKRKGPKGLTVALILSLVIITVVAAAVIGNVYKKSQTINEPGILDEVETPEEFDLTTNEGKVMYVDSMMSLVMTSDVYTDANWLGRKHYVYTELLRLEDEELIKAIHYDTPTRSFSIEHMDGSIRWYAIRDK